MITRRILLATLATSACVAQAGAHFDPPDLGYEAELHRQYIKSKGQLGNPVPQGLTEAYRLQKGETLWSLSEMLYGDGNYWPRVWAQNKGISNPHLIRPGHELQLLLGSEDETPAFRFSEEDDAGLELTAANGQNPIVEIPPPEVPPKPVLKVPESFPQWQSVYKKRPDKMLDDRALGKDREKIPDRIYLRAWVQETPVQGQGEFMEADAEGGLPLPNQYVFVKMKKGTGAEGMRMLVVRDGGKIKKLNKQWEGDEEAYLVQVAAELEIREAVPAEFKRSRDRENYQAYRALITRTTGLSFKGFQLIPGTLQTLDLTMNGSHGVTTAQVIGSEKHEASAMFGQGDLVFLNKGSSSGIEEGQLLDIFPNRTIRRSDAEVTFSPVPSGTVKVVKVTNRLATAVLLSSRDSIQQGDQVREVSSRAGGAEELDSIPSENGNGDDELAPADDESGGGVGDEENLEQEMDESETF